MNHEKEALKRNMNQICDNLEKGSKVLYSPKNETVEELVKLNRTCGCSLGWCVECLKWEGVIEVAISTQALEEKKELVRDLLEKVGDVYLPNSTPTELRVSIKALAERHNITI